MQVDKLPAVDIALRTLGPQDRQQVLAWMQHLENWESDPFVRDHSYKLGSEEEVYVLHTSGDFRIFFRLTPGRIRVLDIATRATILLSGGRSGTGHDEAP